MKLLPVFTDEYANIAHRHFFAVVRALMLHDVLSPLCMFEQGDLPSGLNRVRYAHHDTGGRSHYIFIGDDTSFFTTELPAEMQDHPINEVELALPEPKQARLWQYLESEHRWLITTVTDPLLKEHIDASFTALENWLSTPRSEVETRTAHRIREIFDEIQRRVDVANGGGLYLFEPLASVIEEFLRHRVTGFFAQDVLTGVLASLCMDSVHPIDNLLDQAEHLHDLAYRHIQSSERSDLAVFYQHRGLAYIYGIVSVRLFGHYLEILGEPDTKVSRKIRAIDELITHHCHDAIMFAVSARDYAHHPSPLNIVKNWHPRIDADSTTDITHVEAVDLLHNPDPAIPNPNGEFAFLSIEWLPVGERLLRAYTARMVGQKLVQNLFSDKTNRSIDTRDKGLGPDADPRGS